MRKKYRLSRVFLNALSVSLSLSLSLSLSGCTAVYSNVSLHATRILYTPTTYTSGAVIFLGSSTRARDMVSRFASRLSFTSHEVNWWYIASPLFVLVICYILLYLYSTRVIILPRFSFLLILMLVQHSTRLVESLENRKISKRFDPAVLGFIFFVFKRHFSYLVDAFLVHFIAENSRPVRTCIESKAARRAW